MKSPLPMMNAFVILYLFLMVALMLLAQVPVRW